MRKNITILFSTRKMLDNSALINTIYPILNISYVKKIVKIYAIIIKIQIQKKII